MIKKIILLLIIGMSTFTLYRHKFIRWSSHHPKRPVELEQMRERIYAISLGKLGKPGIGVGYRNQPSDHILGTCNVVVSKASTEIDIDRSAWRISSFLENAVLLAHEYMHCECFRWHNNEVHADGCPVSIMHKYRPSDYCINKHIVAYLYEIHKGCKQ